MSPSIQEEVEAITDDVNNIWKRRDKKYGDKSKPVDSIMADIKGFRSTGEDSSALEMIETVDKAYKDLERMGLQHVPPLYH